MSLLLDSQQAFLRDEAATSAFRDAIRKIVKPGDTVLDLGCGTGLLGFFACQAGARRVYAIDDSGMTGVAARIAQANGLADRIEYIEGHSTRMTLPERVDVMVGDLLGRMGYEAGMFQTYADARRRLLRAGGVTIPSRVDFLIAPVEAEQAWSRADFWRGQAAGFDLGAAAVNAANTVYAETFGARQLLAEPATVTSADPASIAPPAVVRGRATFEVRRDGVVHGLAGWFRALLAPGVELTNCPLGAQRTPRANGFLPLAAPVHVARGDRIAAGLDLIPAQSMASWQVRITDTAGALMAGFRHSTLDGLLIAREDLRRLAPDYVPRLDPWGEARRTVVNLCDGQRSVGVISAELLRRHAELFDSIEEAAAFAGEVIMAYSP